MELGTFSLDFEVHAAMLINDEVVLVFIKV
jgi:hypothetical protein